MRQTILKSLASRDNPPDRDRHDIIDELEARLEH